MLDAFVSGFWQTVAWPAFGYMLLGIIIGFWVGLLPGIGGLSTLALMLPFSYSIKEPVSAFAFLLGMLAVTGTTGDLTSILFGIPGEGSSAALILDGYPMSKNGEAGRALGAAIMSSLVGSVIGALSLAVSIPIVRPLVLLFGSPELFVIAIMGITFIGTLAGTSLIKGLLAGGVGLMLAAIGVDPQTGSLRYTFGWLYLWDGLDVTPVVVGMFAIPEIIDLAVRGTSISQAPKEKLKGVMEGVKDTFRHFWLVVRCSLIGVYFGVLPVLGANVAQWIAYGHAARSLEDKSRAGKGAVEGVLGPGAANNSTLGGSLITTIAFGVPASVIMAILLGAFIIQGIVPGPDMLLPPPKGHLDLTFSFVWVIIISNIITVAICFLFLKPIAKVTQVRGSIIIPIILVLIYLGAFAEKNAFEDMIIVLFFGALGWVMEKLHWPRPPVLLGLVLGPLAENRLFLSTDNYGLAWIHRPGATGIFALTLLGILYLFINARREAREQSDAHR